MYKDKKIFILGMARSGYEVAKLLSKDNKILIVDGKEQDEQHVNELKLLNIQVIITKEQDKLLDESYDLLIKNPGIKYDNSTIVKANKLGIDVINEVEVAYHYLPKDITIIGVTGSNGKTTTTTLIYEFLKANNSKVHLGGNIGYPLSSIVNDVKSNDIVLLEISDHQLCNVVDFKTDISVLTNITPTHLDFHPSYEDYIKMKGRIFNHHTSNDLSIINYDNEIVMNLVKNIPSRKQYFSDIIEKDIYIKNNYICYKDEKINLDDIRIKGMHNYENIMCAILVVEQFNVSFEFIKKVLKNFNGVEHRIEYVDNIKGITIYNDSKATNPKSTKVALSSFNTPTILIMGGMDRKEDFMSLKEALKYTKLVICYGETKNKIKDAMNKLNIDCIVLNNLVESTKEAFHNAKAGDTILLSPCCASWDQYDNFEDRGKEFKNTVKEIENI